MPRSFKPTHLADALLVRLRRTPREAFDAYAILCFASEHGQSPRKVTRTLQDLVARGDVRLVGGRYFGLAPYAGIAAARTVESMLRQAA